MAKLEALALTKSQAALAATEDLAAGAPPLSDESRAAFSEVGDLTTPRSALEVSGTDSDSDE
jgi:hypothetical protein